MSSSAAPRELVSLQSAALACHALLIVTLALTAIGEHATAVRALVAAALVAPLLATLPGLARGHRGTRQWLTVLLVLYVGATSIEVVARAGAPLVSTALLAGVAELGVLLGLIRQSRDRSPNARG